MTRIYKLPQTGIRLHGIMGNLPNYSLVSNDWSKRMCAACPYVGTDLPHICKCLEPMVTQRFCSQECLDIHLYEILEDGEPAHAPELREMLEEIWKMEVN